VIATDANGKIIFAQPVESNKLEKLSKVLNTLNEGKPAELDSKPFIVSTEEQFDEHFNLVLKEVGELSSNHPEAMDLLSEFSWKGMIAIMITRLEIDYTQSPKFRAKFMLNLKAKESQLKRFFEITEFDKLRKERWEKPGYHFKINITIIPVISVDLCESSSCKDCGQALSKDCAQFHSIEISEQFES
jgi:hypothetical protein